MKYSIDATKVRREVEKLSSQGIAISSISPNGPEQTIDIRAHIQLIEHLIAYAMNQKIDRFITNSGDEVMHVTPMQLKAYFFVQFACKVRRDCTFSGDGVADIPFNSDDDLIPLPLYNALCNLGGYTQAGVEGSLKMLVPQDFQVADECIVGENWDPFVLSTPASRSFQGLPGTGKGLCTLLRDVALEEAVFVPTAPFTPVSLSEYYNTLNLGVIRTFISQIWPSCLTYDKLPDYAQSPNAFVVLKESGGVSSGAAICPFDNFDAHLGQIQNFFDFVNNASVNNQKILPQTALYPNPTSGETNLPEEAHVASYVMFGSKFGRTNIRGHHTSRSYYTTVNGQEVNAIPQLKPISPMALSYHAISVCAASMGNIANAVTKIAQQPLEETDLLCVKAYRSMYFTLYSAMMRSVQVNSFASILQSPSLHAIGSTFDSVLTSGTVTGVISTMGPIIDGGNIIWPFIDMRSPDLPVQDWFQIALGIVTDFASVNMPWGPGIGIQDPTVPMAPNLLFPTWGDQVLDPTWAAAYSLTNYRKAPIYTSAISVNYNRFVTSFSDNTGSWINVPLSPKKIGGPPMLAYCSVEYVVESPSSEKKQCTKDIKRAQKSRIAKALSKSVDETGDGESVPPIQRHGLVFRELTQNAKTALRNEKRQLYLNAKPDWAKPLPTYEVFVNDTAVVFTYYFAHKMIFANELLLDQVMFSAAVFAFSADTEAVQSDRFLSLYKYSLNVKQEQYGTTIIDDFNNNLNVPGGVFVRAYAAEVQQVHSKKSALGIPLVKGDNEITCWWNAIANVLSDIGNAALAGIETLSTTGNPFQAGAATIDTLVKGIDFNTSTYSSGPTDYTGLGNRSFVGKGVYRPAVKPVAKPKAQSKRGSTTSSKGRQTLKRTMRSNPEKRTAPGKKQSKPIGNPRPSSKPTVTAKQISRKR